MSKQGNTGDIPIRMLETRLDASVPRSGLARTIYAARQYVTHEHFQVNGIKVKSPGYKLKAGDVLQVKENSRKLACFREALSQAVPPVYLEVSEDELKARLVSLPKREEIPVECEIGQVVEFSAQRFASAFAVLFSEKTRYRLLSPFSTLQQTNHSHLTISFITTCYARDGV